ncbi:MAG TPA: SRPBCC family protein [Polyangiaceae bacterium]|nr:SRPBCC family protein [Polyangiaceae bacterium]
MSSSTTADRIEKRITLRAPRTRVWRALSEASQFGAWFGMKFEGPFEAGKTIRGNITTRGYEHLSVELRVERVEPEQLFSYRWHPYAIDAEHDYSAEPMTLVEFRLSETTGGTELSIVESGFERIPVDRRAEAFRMNDGGWSAQLKNIERYVAGV